MKLATELNNVVDCFAKSSEFLNLLEPLLHALQWKGSLRSLIEALPEQKESLNIVGLRHILHQLKFNSYEIQQPLTKINTKLTPFIFVPNNAPAMLVVAVLGKRVSAINSLTQKLEQFDLAKINGTAYLFREVTPKLAPKRPASWFKAKVFKLIPLGSQILLLSLLMHAFSLAIPGFVLLTCDQVLTSNSFPLLIGLSLVTAVALAGNFLLTANRNKIIALLAAKISYLSSTSIFNKLLYLSPKYTEAASVGSQLSRMKDFTVIKDFLQNPVTTALFEIPVTIVALGLMFFLSPKLSMLTMGMILLTVCMFFMLNFPYQRRNQKYLLANHQCQTFQTEALTNLPTIKSFASENTWLANYKKLFTQATTSGFQTNFLAAIINAIADGITLLTTVAIFYFGTQQVLNYQLTIGALFASMLLSWQALNPIKTLLNLLPQITQMQTSLKQISKLLTFASEEITKPTTSWSNEVKESLSLEHVCFRYNEGEPLALRDISLTVNTKQIICIAGSNGSGKSTLLKLLAKLYQPQAGKIKLDATDLQQMPTILHRQNISYLPQTPQIFINSIEQNILIANPIATQAEIITACKLAGIYEFIMQLPMQLQTVTNDPAHNLLNTTEFKQRLGLVRAFVRKAPIYLFDEPTNSFALEAIQAFIQTVTELKNSATVFIATHEPKLIEIADQVIYLQDGAIAKTEVKTIITQRTLETATEVIMTTPSNRKDKQTAVNLKEN